MGAIINTTEFNTNEIFSSENLSGYYLISLRWSMINDQHITFVRKNKIGYCYNAAWAGPMTKHDIQQLKRDPTTIVIHSSLIKNHLIKLKNEIVLPNTYEIRAIIGFDRGNLQMAN